MNDKVVLTIQVLNKKIFSIEKLKGLLSEDKRKFESDIQKLIGLNKIAFRFLGVEAKVIYDNNFNYSLCLTSSNYSGVIPIRSAGNGLICGYLKVIGRYGEEMDEVLSLLRNEDFTPEFDDSMVIGIDMAVAPPKYIECAMYIDKYEQAERFHWQKFSNRTLIQTRPRNTDWTKYALKSYSPYNAIKYPNRINELTMEHSEWGELQYVLTIAISELESTRTPISIKSHYRNNINRLKRVFNKRDLVTVDQIVLRASDPIFIRELKTIANSILKDKLSTKCAWRIDYSKFFERYVQYLFGQLAYKIGAKVIKNPHFGIRGQKPIWAIKYLEPDLVITMEDTQVVVDVKYKSHMYNWDSDSTGLHDSFRQDFHQVLAYSSFHSDHNKKTIIAYPCNEFRHYTIFVRSSINDCENQTLLLGIPITKVQIPYVVKKLHEVVQSKTLLSQD